MKAPRHLFVYGTLRPGHAPPSIAAEAARCVEVARATVHGRVVDLGAYPGAVLDRAASTTVGGIVLRLPDDPAVLAALDAYEGFIPRDRARSLFVRTRTVATLVDGTTIPCWAYVWNGGPLRRRGRGRSSSRAPSRRGAPSR